MHRLLHLRYRYLNPYKLHIPTHRHTVLHRSCITLCPSKNTSIHHSLPLSLSLQWRPTLLLLCWSSGTITVVTGSSCLSLFSSHSPDSLPLQQVTVGMKWAEVPEQLFLSPRRVAAFLTHVELVAALLVGVCLGDAVDLLHVGLQWAALGEGLLAEGALVRTDSCMERASHFSWHPCIMCLWQGCANMEACSYLCVCVRDAWGQRCRWSLCHRSCTGASWSHCDIWHGGLTSAGGRRSSGKPANSNITFTFTPK